MDIYLSMIVRLDKEVFEQLLIFSFIKHMPFFSGVFG